MLNKISLLVLMTLAVVGCGYKGPLYMPKPAKPQSSGPTAANAQQAESSSHATENPFHF